MNSAPESCLDRSPVFECVLWVSVIVSDPDLGLHRGGNTFSHRTDVPPHQEGWKRRWWKVAQRWEEVKEKEGKERKDGSENRRMGGRNRGRKWNVFFSELRVDYISALICSLWLFLQLCSRAAPGVSVCVSVREMWNKCVFVGVLDMCLNQWKIQKHFNKMLWNQNDLFWSSTSAAGLAKKTQKLTCR